MYNSNFSESELMPREKAKEYGIQKLTDLELISILLGSGTKDVPVKILASRILKAIDISNKDISMENLMKVKGVGPAKATIIGASMEFSRRRLTPSVKRVSYPTDILPAVRHFVTRSQEYFIVITLNGAHEIIKSSVVSIGILNKTLIHPREVFADAIKDSAASIIICHNHPSGNLEPSPEDKAVTDRLVEAGDLLGIKVLDHIVFSNDGYFSFLEENLI